MSDIWSNVGAYFKQTTHVTDGNTVETYYNITRCQDSVYAPYMRDFSLATDLWCGEMTDGITYLKSPQLIDSYNLYTDLTLQV